MRFSGEVTIIKSGSAVVTATQAGDNNNEAAVATVAITVEKATPVSHCHSPNTGSITYCIVGYLRHPFPAAAGTAALPGCIRRRSLRSSK